MPIYNRRAIVPIAQTGTASAPHTGSTNETAIWTIPLPRTILPGDWLQLRTLFGSITNNANAKNIRTYIGASGAGIGGTLLTTFAAASVVGYKGVLDILIGAAVNAQAAGINNGSFGGTGSAVATAAIDLAAASEICVSIQLATGSDSVTPRGYSLQLHRA